jgi:hypothetical protein
MLHNSAVEEPLPGIPLLQHGAIWWQSGSFGAPYDPLITIDGPGGVLSCESDESENPAHQMVEILIVE